MIDPENLKKMSKDEIIECCSDIANWGFNDYQSWEQQSAVCGLLDLYKKQQKEIEDLKEKYNKLINRAIVVVFSEDNKDVENLARTLYHQGIIQRDKYNYLNPYYYETD